MTLIASRAPPPSSTGLAFTRDQRIAGVVDDERLGGVALEARAGRAAASAGDAEPRRRGSSAPSSSCAAAALTYDQLPVGVLGRDRVGDALEDRAQLGLRAAHQLLQAQVLERHGGLGGEVLEQVALDGAERRWARMTASTWLCPTPIASAFAASAPSASSAASSAGARSPIASRGCELPWSSISLRRPASACSASTVVASRIRSSAGAVLRGVGLARAASAAGLAAQVLGARVERAGGAPEGALERELVRDPRRCARARSGPAARRARSPAGTRARGPRRRARRGSRSAPATRRSGRRARAPAAARRARSARRSTRAAVEAHEVDGDLRGEREQQDADAASSGGPSSSAAIDQRRADRVPAVGDDHQQPLGVRAPAQQLRQLAEHRRRAPPAPAPPRRA